MSEKTQFIPEKLGAVSVWKHFEALSQIPRCSKNEKKVLDYIRSAASEKGLPSREDRAGNLLITVPASDGKNRPSVCLQSHVDMVCEKNSDSNHNFTEDPLQLHISDGMLFAGGTTLGADNGIGAAMMLALCEKDSCEHPELELLFTVDEEAGMSGAFGIEENFIHSKRLINLDTEEENHICIGCSGGLETENTLSVSAVLPEKGFSPLRIEVKNLRGGHSGLNIHLGRGNAIRILAELLNEIKQNQKIFLAEISGGRARNAIPREAECVLFLRDTRAFEKTAAVMRERLMKEYSGAEENIEISFHAASGESHFSSSETENIICFLLESPLGVIAMSSELPGLVRTSTNTGIVRTENHSVLVGCLSRSSDKNEQRAVADDISKTAVKYGFQTRRFGEYPPWPYNLNSELLKSVMEIYRSQFQINPKTVAVHAGLETGIIGEKFPGMDMISIGPDIFFPHSPREHVSIESVDRVWEQLKEILSRI